jgi:hypothetical protein
MAKASKIGSLVYNALPAYWRQGWMYRAFTGEAYTMLKAGKKEEEIQQLLMQRYVEPIVNKQSENAYFVPLNKEPKRAYRKLDTAYWRKKTVKVARPLAACWYILKDNSILSPPCISVFHWQLRRSRHQLSACTLFLWRRSLTGQELAQ